MATTLLTCFVTLRHHGVSTKLQLTLSDDISRSGSYRRQTSRDQLSGNTMSTVLLLMLALFTTTVKYK